MNFFLLLITEKRKRIMKKAITLLKIAPILVFIPFEISRASKRRAFMRIKKMMVAANLL